MLGDTSAAPRAAAFLERCGSALAERLLDLFARTTPPRAGARELRQAMGPAAPPAAAVADALSSIDLGLHGECGAADALDGMTYAWVDVRHPDKTDFVRVRTLVDTGSTDCELKGDVIRKLGLPATGETAHFETAVGRVTEQPIYEAVIRVLGREARVVLSPADGDESDDESDESDEELDARFGFDRVSDEGMLGHTALAALNLAVDCRKRRLVALPDE